MSECTYFISASCLQKTAPTQIGHDHYTYDANGNPTLVTNDSTNTTREVYWDEDNHLMVLSDNGKTSCYIYSRWRVSHEKLRHG